MSFSDVLRFLRRRNDMTQEDLAEALDMSPQAVSRWETGTAFPDSAIIRKLAYLFDVTTDYLLEVDPARMEETVRELLLKADTMAPEEAAQMLRGTLKDYPRNTELMTRLAHCLYYEIYRRNPDGQNSKNALTEAWRLYEQLYERCGSTGHLQSLLRVCRDLGMIERVNELLKPLHGYSGSKEELRIELAEGEEKIRLLKDSAYTLLTMLNFKVYLLSGEESLPMEQRLAMLEQMFETNRTLMPDDPLNSWTWQATHLPFQLAQLSAVNGDREKAIHWLEVMREASRNEKGTLQSPVFRGLERKRNGRWHEEWMLQVLGHNCFADLRDDPRITAMREELEETLRQYGIPQT